MFKSFFHRNFNITNVELVQYVRDSSGINSAVKKLYDDYVNTEYGTTKYIKVVVDDKVLSFKVENYRHWKSPHVKFEPKKYYKGGIELKKYERKRKLISKILEEKFGLTNYVIYNGDRYFILEHYVIKILRLWDLEDSFSIYKTDSFLKDFNIEVDGEII